MARGEKVGNKQYGRRGIRSKDKDSDESDEDYTVGEDEEFDDSEEYCSSLDEEESEDSFCEFEEVEEEEEEEEEEKETKKKRKVGRPKGQSGFRGRKKTGSRRAHKKRRVSSEEENDEDYEDEDDDDEFTPDEVDLEDEDEVVVRRKKKLGKPSLREEGFVQVRKRKLNSRFMKKPTKIKPTNSHGLSKSSAADNDEGAFTNNNQVVKQKTQKNDCPRKRRFIIDSDSDPVSSGSSDFEYTISEEEREQVKEASEFCGDFTLSLRNSSLRTRLQEEGALLRQRKRLGRKGKEKVEDLKFEAGKQVCGICLSEEGAKTVRGTLNCCSHYFCFACIVEWSKVESRCPLCKQRFMTISKPARSSTGFDLRTVVVQVPERDQVYQPSEEELRGYLDPYENVICTECQQGGDDALMLLCDLCDSPAHTYCVGLGREVPEGNWYCEGCRPTALVSSNPLASNLTTDHRTIDDFSGRLSPVETVREAIDLNRMYVPETPPTLGTGVSSSPRHPGVDFQAASPALGPGVSTVSERRRIQRQIHHLLNSRISQLSGRTNGMPPIASGNNLWVSQVGRVRETAFQHATRLETLPSHNIFPHERLQDNFTPSMQSRDLFPSRPGHSTAQQIQGQTSTSTDGSANGMLQAGLIGINRGINSRLGHEQLHPCSNRSSINNASMSPYS
ncbi:uncharacterized protein LOC127802529 [Diospyros lotus]|uniref:uncharacterized protein LOC127802529 n=1 Tax=Diospyros lotus TaxID=55363 RepID=UPI002259657A|nr:uncharacterized protein LOC127802529 [Diospyros lotus]XP_052194346.1 uncharacterized protein LOC127802529 [Diospyros lotus]